MNKENESNASTGLPKRFGGYDYIKITIFGLGANAIWQCLHIVIIPLLVLNFVVESQKNTYLGLLTFCGLFLAMITQPIMGAISDRYGFTWGRRRPYVLYGGIAALLLLPGIGFAQSYITLLLIYCFFQIALNAAYVPYQAFIPDMVAEKKRGLASGVKGLMEMLGIVIFIYPISLLMDRYLLNQEGIWLGSSLGLLTLLLLVTMLLTVLLIKEKPGKLNGHNSLATTLLQTFKIDVSRNRSFIWFIISRLLVFVAFTTLQQFALNFLMDVTGVANPAEATAQFSVLGVVGIILSIWPAGYIADKIGRKPVTMTACLFGAVGIAMIYLSQNLSTILVASGIIGIAVGSFYSANWALATDLVPKNEEARYLGLVNIATAGGATVARLIGPVIDILNSRAAGWGYRVMLISCIFYLTAGALLMLKVRSKDES